MNIEKPDSHQVCALYSIFTAIIKTFTNVPIHVRELSCELMWLHDCTYEKSNACVVLINETKLTSIILVTRLSKQTSTIMYK